MGIFMIIYDCYINAKHMGNIVIPVKKNYLMEKLYVIWKNHARIRDNVPSPPICTDTSHIRLKKTFSGWMFGYVFG
jgi:hypothetical protein